MKFTILNEQRRPDGQLSTQKYEVDEDDDTKNARAFITGSRTGPVTNSVMTILSQLLGEPLYERKQIDYTYYPSGEIDTMTITTMDATDNPLSQYSIKHYLDGRQPEKL